MKTHELVNRRDGTAADIAQRIVRSAIKTYVPEDIEPAIEKAINKFAQQIREHAAQELKFLRIRKV